MRTSWGTTETEVRTRWDIFGILFGFVSRVNTFFSYNVEKIIIEIKNTTQSLPKVPIKHFLPLM